MNARLLILDEPTSSLTGNEAERLFEIIGQLQKQNIGIIYISHRMSEIFRLCTRVTVLRDGKSIWTKNIKDTSEAEVVTGMVGREITVFYPEKAKSKTKEELLRVENFSSSRFHGISFSLYKGEILGFSGLVGAGRSEVIRAVCGIEPFSEGTVYYQGKKVTIKKYHDAISQGICYLTEDRKKNGLFLHMSVMNNISSTVIDNLASHKLINRKKEKDLAVKQIKKMRIKTTGEEVKVKNLSGGNQQKVMIAKWLAVTPSILIMDEPTRGIDVGAKSEIHHMLRELCGQGIGIIIVSSEMPEIIGMCDRVVVMHEGKLMGIAEGEMINETNLIMLASNQMEGQHA
jgi:ribose transport system ATP-binding protein